MKKLSIILLGSIILVGCSGNSAKTVDATDKKTDNTQGITRVQPPSSQREEQSLLREEQEPKITTTKNADGSTTTTKSYPNGATESETVYSNGHSRIDKQGAPSTTNGLTTYTSSTSYNACTLGSGKSPPAGDLPPGMTRDGGNDCDSECTGDECPHFIFNFTDTDGKAKEYVYRGEKVTPRVSQNKIHANVPSTNVYHWESFTMSYDPKTKTFKFSGTIHHYNEDDDTPDITFQGSEKNCKIGETKKNEAIFLTFECEGNEDKDDFSGELYIPKAYILPTAS